MTSLDQLIGEDPEIESIREEIRWLAQGQPGARRPLSILILGEAGTGKGLVARAIHAGGPRASGPFIRVDCAALPEALFEAGLAGLEEADPRGAQQAAPDPFRAAAGGTIFLDELGRLTSGQQAGLLDVVERRASGRSGDARGQPADAWIVATSSHDLLAGIRKGHFREDLYRRLAAVSLRLPPLRERGRDILLLAERFMARACVAYGAPPRTLAPSAREALLAHSWPGNLRELAHVMERVVLFSEATEVTAETLDDTETPAYEPAAPRGTDGRESTRHGAWSLSPRGRWSTLAGACATC